MPTRVSQDPAALDAYLAAQQQAHALLAELTTRLDGHQDATAPDSTHWGHVGDLTKLCADLTRILDY
jgi:hypothetical protein